MLSPPLVQPRQGRRECCTAHILMHERPADAALSTFDECVPSQSQAPEPGKNAGTKSTKGRHRQVSSWLTWNGSAELPTMHHLSMCQCALSMTLHVSSPTGTHAQEVLSFVPHLLSHYDKDAGRQGKPVQASSSIGLLTTCLLPCLVDLEFGIGSHLKHTCPALPHTAQPHSPSPRHFIPPHHTLSSPYATFALPTPPHLYPHLTPPHLYFEQ